MTELIGQTLGSYQIEALLGAGPAGPRYAARHTRLQRPAALRLFPADLATRPEERRRLLAALRAAAGLRHPHIVEIYDVGEQGGRLFVAAELLAGGTLRALLQRHRQNKTRPPLAAALALARQAADGVAFAHAQGITHGAVSPELLRLGPEAAQEVAPLLKVDEFGVAASFPDEAAAVPAYLTPEQCRGLAVGPRGDVYALGVLLYELTVGAPPFNVTTLAQAVEKHVRTRPVPPRMVRPQLPAALEAVVLRCLAKAPEDRFANAGELAEAVRQIEAALPGAAAPPPPVVAPAQQLTPPAFPLPAALTAAAPPAPPPPLPPFDDDDPLLTGLLGATPPQGVAAAAAAPTVAAGGPLVGVEVDQEQVGLTPGRPNFVNVRVVNRGAAVDNFTLSVEGVPGEWLRDVDQPVRLTPGQAVVVPIVVEPPPGGRGEAGDYAALVRARSVSNQAISGTARMRWTVLPYAAASLTITPASAEGATDADYTLTLRNEGNADAAFLLSADDREQLLGYELGQEQLELRPGQSARIPLIVEGPRKLFGRPDEFPFAVYAEPDNGETVTAEAVFVRRPLMPTWLPVLAAALLLGLLLLWLLLPRAGGGVAGATPTAGLPTAVPTPQPGAPVVAAFTVSAPVVAPGEPVTLFWDVRGAERVVIDQFGDVPPLGQREFRPVETTDFRLVASAGGLETIAIQRVLVAPPTPTPELSPVATATLLPTAVPPPTLAPILPTAPPATATLVPPTATPLPPTATPLPPTATVAQPTPVPASINLIDLAPGASWSTTAGPIAFGRPNQGVEAGGWAEIAADVALEDGGRAPNALYTFPPAGPQPGAVTDQQAPPYLEASFNLPAIQPGQFFLAQVGFAQGASGPGVRVLVTFNNEIVYEGRQLPDGQLTAISADLARFAGRAGQLELRVTADAGPSPTGVYWVQPRIDLPIGPRG